MDTRRQTNQSLNAGGNSVEIDIKRDGVYLNIHHPSGSPKISRTDVLSLIESYGVSDVDYIKLSEALKSESEDVSVKISGNTNIVQVDESVTVEISKNRMEAFITFVEPANRGKCLTLNEIMDAIAKAGVVGVDPERINELIKNKKYGRKEIILQGKIPVAGVDGFLQYHFDNSNLRPKPKIMDDGTVNFHQLGIFRLCNRGDVLVTSVPPKDGVNGVDVTGRVLPCQKGRLPLPIPKGKNTVVSTDGLHLIADSSGQLLIQGGKINISPCLEIKGNVDNSTGDIDFNGMVTIKGNVVSGFKVKAVGNIEVGGVCEAATLISDANIVLGNGAQGSDKAVLIAGGDITARFIESCNVTAGGNIIADSIMKSVVKCDGNVVLSGKNGLLVGGKMTVGNKLSAKTIGSPMGTITEIEVGNNPKELTLHKELVAEYEKYKKEYEKFDMAVNTLNNLKQRGQLSEDKKNALLKMINAKMIIREKMTKLQTEIDELVVSLTTNKGIVSASKLIRSGVRVTIGNSQLSIRDELQNCSLRNNGSKIAIGPYL